MAAFFCCFLNWNIIDIHIMLVSGVLHNWFDSRFHYKMIITVNLVMICLHGVMWLLAIKCMLYVTFPRLIYFMTRGWYLLMSSSLFAQPLTFFLFGNQWFVLGIYESGLVFVSRFRSVSEMIWYLFSLSELFTVSIILSGFIHVIADDKDLISFS